MPGINPPADSYLVQQLVALDRRLKALETQQNLVFADVYGNPRVKLGLLDDGDYGLAVYLQRPDGSTPYVELSNAVQPQEAQIWNAESTTSTTDTDLTTVGPTINANLGPTGMAVCWVSAKIQAVGPASASTTGNAWLYMDGVAYGTRVSRWGAARRRPLSRARRARS